MPSKPFARSGRFFEGKLHSHSTRPDGVLPSDEACRRCRARKLAAALADFVARLRAALHAPPS